MRAEGISQLIDAGLTEQEVMGHSGHASSKGLAPYFRRSEKAKNKVGVGVGRCGCVRACM